MNIEIKHVITLAPEVLTILQAFLGKGQQNPAPVALGSSPSAKAEEKAVAKIEAPVEVAKEPVVAKPSETVTVEQVRAIAKQRIDAGKMAQVKEILTSFEAKSITALDAKHYTEFVEKVKAI